MVGNCNSNSSLKWVQGNDMLLLARVYEKVMESNTVTDAPFDLTACDDIAVKCSNSYMTEALESAIAQDEDNCLVLRIPASLTVGGYDIEVTCRRGGFQVRSFEFAFEVVEKNCESNTTFSIVDGCQSANLRVSLQIVPQSAERGKSAYELWKELPGNADKTLQDYIDEVLDLHGRAAALDAVTERAEAASEAAEQAAAAIVHPDYVGEDNYVYHWNTEQGAYAKTDIYVKGDKGDAFTYEDFTPQQIADLQKPATDAAEALTVLSESISSAERQRAQAESQRGLKENERQGMEVNRQEAEEERRTKEQQRESDCAAAVAAANAAATSAGRVNITVSGTTLTVTDKNGNETSVNTKGEKGEKGDTGAKGDKGDKGEKGDTGAKGDKGDTGAKGDTGERGPKGDRGDAGRDGADGRDGRDGTDGTDGQDGQDGADGITPSLVRRSDGVYVTTDNGQTYTPVAYFSDLSQPNVVQQVSQTATIHPNVLNVWGSVSSLTISLAAGAAEVVNEYMMQFTVSGTAFTLSLPDGIRWIDEPDFVDGATYQVSIVNNLAVAGEWEAV